ncbi:MAG: branched-chain amino acid ABC transporter permease [Chitinispirillales bacterium]|jgi:hypothetical protein|nr:branched-chain amino acid ABC transporter permease [Chitinispirillales bacterium]
MEYILHLLILIGIYAMLSQSLNLSAGFGGMISLAHAGFYGVGAYTAALLAVNHQLPFLLTLPVAMLLSGVLALIVSAIALRTIDDYFIICTLGIKRRRNFHAITGQECLSDQSHSIYRKRNDSRRSEHTLRSLYHPEGSLVFQIFLRQDSEVSKKWGLVERAGSAKGGRWAPASLYCFFYI